MGIWVWQNGIRGARGGKGGRDMDYGEKGGLKKGKSLSLLSPSKKVLFSARNNFWEKLTKEGGKGGNHQSLPPYPASLFFVFIHFPLPPPFSSLMIRAAKMSGQKKRGEGEKGAVSGMRNNDREERRGTADLANLAVNGRMGGGGEGRGENSEGFAS